ncbi:MAG: hypothetical protein Q8O74_04745, partial [bacterium]|nr:hypothetical protein [bacterium]
TLVIKLINNSYLFFGRPCCHARKNGHPGLDSRIPTPACRNNYGVQAGRGAGMTHCAIYSIE